jgi:hypothetical protein
MKIYRYKFIKVLGTIIDWNQKNPVLSPFSVFETGSGTATERMHTKQNFNRSSVSDSVSRPPSQSVFGFGFSLKKFETESMLRFGIGLKDWTQDRVISRFQSIGIIEYIFRFKFSKNVSFNFQFN